MAMTGCEHCGVGPEDECVPGCAPPVDTADTAEAIVAALANLPDEVWVYDYYRCQFCAVAVEELHEADCLYRRALAWVARG
jgi:hypothetical protein